MTQAPKNLVAMAHVADVPRSIAFYERLGFVATATHTPEGSTTPVWAHLDAGRAMLMVTLASEPVDPRLQAVLFYLYFDDIHATHASLAAEGLEVGPITYPFYCPGGEFALRDPDGYCLMLTHV